MEDNSAFDHKAKVLFSFIKFQSKETYFDSAVNEVTNFRMLLTISFSLNNKLTFTYLTKNAVCQHFKISFIQIKIRKIKMINISISIYKY